MPEISAEEWQVASGARALLDKLLKSPKTQLATQRLIKSAVPDVQIETVEDNPIYTELQETRSTLRELQKSLEESAIDSKLEREFDKLRSQGFTDDGIEAVKKLMVDRKIPHASDAAAVYEKMNPPKPTDRPSGYGTDWGFGRKQEGDEDRNLLLQNEDAFAEQEARRFFDELAKGNQIKY
jgi:hypothetical protein